MYAAAAADLRVYVHTYCRTMYAGERWFAWHGAAVKIFAIGPRRVDPDNLIAACKPAIDGLEDHGVLVNDQRDDLRTAASVLFHLSPASVPLGVVLGLGFGSSNVPDLYLGGTIRILNPVLLNAGAVWQRQQLLSGGLQEGDAIMDPFDPDDLDKKYKAGFFAG